MYITRSQPGVRRSRRSASLPRPAAGGCALPFAELLEPRRLFATVPTGFAAEEVLRGLSSPTAMDFAPDGRLFVCQQGGALRVVKNGALLATPFTSLTVDFAGERGLLGVAFDPNYAANRFVYVYHTVPAPTGGSPHNRVTRFTASAANPDVAEAGSGVPILDLENLTGASNHNGGAIHFGPDGKLYVAVGENATRANAQSFANRLGKILRINPDGSTPADNPFVNDANVSGLNKQIWALGLRNPYTFTFDPATGRMHINDVGESTWEEVNVGQAGANYGWSTIEGPRTTQVPPVNYADPLHAYRHPFTGSDPGQVGIAITGGAFYARQPAAVAPFPDAYNGDYFFADFGTGATAGNWIRRLDAGTGNSFAFLTGASSPVDLKLGPDGALYYLERGNGGALQRVRFTVAAPTNVDLATPSDTGVSTTDNVTNAAQLTFTGAATPNATVRLFDDGVQVTTTTANANGAFTVTAPIAAGPSAITFTADGATVSSATSLPLSILIDRKAPTVTAAFELAFAQRVRLSFDEDVRDTLAADDLKLSPAHATTLETSGGAPLMPTEAWFTPTAILPDGHYTATLASADVTDIAGNPLAADVNFPFFVYAADADHNGTVDFNDLVPLAQNYNMFGGMSFFQGDFNYDGDVDFDDLVMLAQRYNTPLPAAPVDAAPVTAATITASREFLASPTDDRKKLATPVFSVTPVNKPVARPKPTPRPLRR